MKKKPLRTWDEVITLLNDLEARIHKLQTTTYVPFLTPEFDAAIRRTMRGLTAAHGVATGKVSSRQRREIRQARKSALVTQRAKGMPELVGHLPPRLRPRPAI
jgi:hypothetical protein